MNNTTEFYIKTYGDDAKIPVENFPVWVMRARMELSRITGGKTLSSGEDRVNVCLCEMAEYMYEAGQRSGIVSENNDGYSVRYSADDGGKALYQIAVRCLSGTDYLFRGDVCDS